MAITINGVVITNPTDIANWRRAFDAELAAQDLVFLEKQRGDPAALAAAQDLLKLRRAATQSAATVAVNNAQAGQTPQNAGAQTQQAQTARDDGANNQRPPGPPLAQNANGRVGSAQTPPPTNAQPTTSAPNAGLNAPTRTGANTQATPATTAQPIQTPRNTPSVGSTAAGWIVNPVNALTNAVIGAFSSGDDAYTNALRSRINQFVAANSKIEPQANLLGQYYSYTYNISIYIMAPADYKKMVLDKTHFIPGYQLLMQSGGAPFVNEQNATPQGTAPVGTGNNPVNNTQGQKVASAGRNQYFPLDFYIDDVKVQQLVPGKGSKSPHGITQMNFKISEPNGLSLIDNLFNATQAYTGKRQNYASQNYLMVIRFYGYDQNGNLVRAAGFPANNSTAPGPVVEKYIPFQLTNITFKIANKITEYNCSAIVPQNAVASGQGRGTIPYNVELSAATLNEVFNSKASFSSTSIFDKLRTLISGGRETQSTSRPSTSNTSPTPAKAGSAPGPTLTSGLVDALNTYEREHVQNGIFEIADEYAVIFTDDILATAKLTPPGSVVKGKTDMNNNVTASQQKNPNKQSVDVNSKNTSAVAGTSIIQFIDQTVRNSRYIYDQQTKIIDPETQKEKPNGTAANALAWYRIGLQVEPKGYDFKRNDYAYKITYQVSPYLVNDIKSDYFPQGEFRGVQKRYAYWFTGENTEVLNYEQDFNSLFYLVANTGNQVPAGSDIDYREVEKRMYQTRSNQSDQGQDGKVNEPGANAADRLYSPADLSKVKLQIIGDPAWIAQGEIWSGIAGSSFKYDPFLPDGTINGEPAEVLFEVAWNKPVDYNLETGIQDPYQQGNGANSVIAGGGSNKKTTTQSNIYKATTISSTFSQGKFTQDLEGVLVNFPIKKPDKAPPTLTQRLLNTATSGARSLLNSAADNKGTDIVSLGVKASAKIIRGAVNGVEYVVNRNQASNAATTAENAARSQRTPVPSQGARPPTSNGQAVGPASTSQSRQPSGGTAVNTQTTTTFNEATFQQNNPVAWSQFVQYRQAEQVRIYNLERASLTRQAQNGVIFNNTISPRQQAQIDAKATQISNQQAQQNAVAAFQNAIVSSGAGGTTTTTTPANTAQVNTASYTITRDF
jgi:hypothetical protein